MLAGLQIDGAKKAVRLIDMPGCTIVFTNPAGIVEIAEHKKSHIVHRGFDFHRLRSFFYKRHFAVIDIIKVGRRRVGHACPIARVIDQNVVFRVKERAIDGEKISKRKTLVLHRSPLPAKEQPRQGIFYRVSAQVELGKFFQLLEVAGVQNRRRLNDVRGRIRFVGGGEDISRIGDLA